MSFAGDLKKLPIADVFQSIHQNSMSGALAIRDPLGERLVAFKEGFIVGCAAPVGEEHGIAEELVRRRMIDAKDARPSRFFRRKGSLLKSLQKKNVLDPAGFAQLTRTLVLERVYDCFLLEEGNFEFIEAYDHGRFDEEEEAAGVKVAPAEVLMEAMRRIDEFKRIKRSVPSFREVYVATRAPAEEDKQIFRDILSLTSAGTMPLHEVFHNVPHTKFSCCEAVLSLVNAGDLRVATGPEYLDLGKKAEDKQELDAAAAYYQRGLAYERGNRDLNHRRIAVLEKLRRNQEAADERKLYAGILLEHGDRRAAIEQYARASELAPTDPLPLERLLDLQVEQKDLKESSHSADRLVRVYMQLGLGDKAKGVYPRLLVLNPRDRTLRERLAEVHHKLNEPSTAATIWKELAQEELDKGDEHDAAMLLRRAIEAQPDDQRTQALLKDLESGERSERKKRYRRYVTTGLLSLVVGILLAQLSQEALAIAYVRDLERDALRTLDRGPDAILGAMQAREACRRAFEGTLWASGWAEDSSVELARMFVRELERDQARPRFERLELAAWDNPNDVMTRLNAALDPAGGVKLEDAMKSAEEALGRGDPGTAWRELPALLERAQAARLALVRAGHAQRMERSMQEDQRRLYPLLVRIELLEGRLVATPLCEKAIDDEAARRLAPPPPPGSAPPPPPPGSAPPPPPGNRTGG